MIILQIVCYKVGLCLVICLRCVLLETLYDFGMPRPLGLFLRRLAVQLRVHVGTTFHADLFALDYQRVRFGEAILTNTGHRPLE